MLPRTASVIAPKAAQLGGHGVYGLRYVSEQLQGGLVAVVDLGRQCVQVDQLCAGRQVPQLGVVFHRVVADGQDHVGAGQQLVAGLIGEQSDAPNEVILQLAGQCPSAWKVSTTGSSVGASNRRIAAVASMAPARTPSSRTGMRAAPNIRAARSTACPGAAPITGTGDGPAAGTATVAEPAATSWGSTTTEAPPAGPLALRNALVATSGTLAVSLTSPVNFVIGVNMAAASIDWWVRLSRSARGTAPAVATMGSPSVVAVTRPVARFDAPGPEVTTCRLLAIDFWGANVPIAASGARDSRWQGALMGISGDDAGCLARNYMD